MIKVGRITYTSVVRVSRHLDPKSKQARKDHREHANDYSRVQRFLANGNNWLSSVTEKKQVMIVDATGQQMSETDFHAYVLSSQYDAWGRKRKKAAYHGIWNPPNEIMVLLRSVARQSPTLFTTLVEELTQKTQGWLRNLSGDAPYQLAIHTITGRLHWEWLIPKRDAQGMKIGSGLDWDGKTVSIGHLDHWMKTQKSPKMKLNSRLELELSAYIYRRVRTWVEELKLAPPDIEEGMRFFSSLQKMSLRDRTKSRAPRTASKAQSLLQQINGKYAKAQQIMNGKAKKPSRT